MEKINGGMPEHLGGRGRVFEDSFVRLPPMRLASTCESSILSFITSQHACPHSDRLGVVRHAGHELYPSRDGACQQILPMSRPSHRQEA